MIVREFGDGLVDDLVPPKGERGDRLLAEGSRPSPHDPAHAEADLAYLVTILESSDDAIVSKDLNGVIISWNLAARRIFGYTSAEAVGRPISFLIPPDRRDEELRILERLRHGERVDHFESVRLAKDGRSIDVSLTISPIKDRSGRIVAISKIARDITATNAATAALRLAEQEFRFVVDHVADGIIVIDGGGTVQSFNPAAERIFGYAAADVVGQNVSILMPGPYRDGHDDFRFFNYHATGQPKVTGIGRDVLGRRRDASTFPMDLAISEFYVADGRFYTCLVRDITERKQAEEALRQSEEKFRQVVHAMPQIVWTARSNGCLDHFNERWYEFTGRPRDGRGDESWTPVLHEDDLQRCLDTWYRAVETGEPYEIEYRLRNGQTGEYRWHFGRALPMKHASGRVMSWIGTCTDIDDQKRAEEALRQIEKRFHRLMQNSSDIISILGADGTVLYQSGSIDRILGNGPEKRVGRNVFHEPLVHPDDLVAKHDFFDEVLRRPGTVVSAEFRLRHADGSWRDIEAIGQNLLHDPIVAGIIANYRDITARKRAEDAIRASERIYRAIGETIAYGVWICDPDGRNVYASESFLRLVGLTQDRCSGFGWGDVLHPDDAERTIAAWKECVQVEGAWDSEHRFRGTDGRYHPVLVRGVPVREDDGRIVCWAGINLDIGRLKEAEEALRRREIEFETLAENSPLIIARFDTQFRHLYVNRKIENVSGLPREQFLGRTNRELGLPSDLCAFWEAKLKATIETRTQTDSNFSYEGPSGRSDFHARIVPEFSPDGLVVSVLGVTADVTEYKALQAELLSIAEQEQQRIGQDLHDDVGQELTGVGLMAESLADALEESGASAAVLAAKICMRLGHARERIQAMARGLIPVEVDAHGLKGVLEELTSRLRRTAWNRNELRVRGRAPCRARSNRDADVPDRSGGDLECHQARKAPACPRRAAGERWEHHA